MERVLVVTGTPGVGKSSTSTLLARRLKGMRVDLTDLVKREGLSCGFDEKRKTVIADAERVSARVKEIITNNDGYVIVEGHFAMETVSADDVFLAFVLRRSPDELRRILADRGFEEPKITENVAAEILDVCLFDTVKAYGQKKVCEIETTSRNCENVVDDIIDVLNGHKECSIGIVDWLMKLELEGRLNEFLDSL